MPLFSSGKTISTYSSHPCVVPSSSVIMRFFFILRGFMSTTDLMLAALSSPKLRSNFSHASNTTVRSSLNPAFFMWSWARLNTSRAKSASCTLVASNDAKLSHTLTCCVRSSSRSYKVRALSNSSSCTSDSMYDAHSSSGMSSTGCLTANS